MSQNTGISNRQPPEVEERERRRRPAAESDVLPEPARVAADTEPIEEVLEGHTSHKVGSRSVAQKEHASKYADRSMPQTHKVGGAFGREPAASPERPGRSSSE